MKKEKLYKVTRFHEEKGVQCQSETIVSARSRKDAMEQALEDNDIHVDEMCTDEGDNSK